ncbi:MAG: TatD family hydrolase [Agarilytica sp.]
MLVDSHCHLDRIKLDKYDNGLDGAVAAAREAGVGHQLCVCISEENKNDVLRIAEQYPDISASVGIHPCDVKEQVVEKVDLSAWAQHNKIVAIGETGLDYYYTKDFLEQQHESFTRHLQVAGDLKLPVIVHTRDAREDTIQLIKQHGNLESAGVLHCFTESWDMAKQALDLGYYISMSGIVTFKNAVELKDVAKQVPADKLLIETDSPYLAPVPMRGKPNEPKYVKHVAEYVAELRGLSYEALVEQTGENFFRLFNKAKH